MNATTRRRAPLAVYAFHAVQEKIRPFRWRQRLARLIATTRPKLNTTEQVAEPLKELQKDGFVFLEGLVDDQWVARVRTQLEERLCQDRWRKELGLFRHGAVPEQTHVADINDVIDIPEVLEIANHPRVLALVASYFGCAPTIDSVKAWWSMPGHDEAENEQYFHRDNDSIRFLKLFIYLTDVDMDSGPHTYVRGSHVGDGCYALRRYRDDEVAAAFGSDRILQMVGEAGTTFIEDTYGIHKGQLPARKRRLLLQVRYSVVPSIFMSRATSAGARKIVDEKGYSIYVNRLLMKQ